MKYFVGLIFYRVNGGINFRERSGCVLMFARVV